MYIGGPEIQAWGPNLLAPALVVQFTVTYESTKTVLQRRWLCLFGR